MNNIDLKLTLEQLRDKYFPAEFNLEEHKRKHMLMLARSEELQRNEGRYNNIPESFKLNSTKRINRYIEIRTQEERLTPEYQVFIDSMEKSLAILRS